MIEKLTLKHVLYASNTVLVVYMLYNVAKYLTRVLGLKYFHYMYRLFQGAPMMDYGYMMHTHMTVPAVIAKPPAKKHKAALHAALDSFYSDLATMEPAEEAPAPPVIEPPVEAPKVEVVEVKPVEVPASSKKKKPKKVSAGLGMKKKKGVSSLVAKWQQVQQEVRRDFKTLDDEDEDDS